MTCAFGENIVICRPHMDAWRRVFVRCPVCRCRRLVLGEFQDYYGERFTCLKCGSGWMGGELRKAGKREAPNIVKRAKERIKEYVGAGIEQGFRRYMDKLERERIGEGPLRCS